MQRGKPFKGKDKIVTLFNNGMSPKDIAKEVDLSPQRVYYYMRQLKEKGLIKYGQDEEYLKKVEYVREHYPYTSTKELSERLGLSVRKINNIAMKRGVKKLRITKEYVDECIRLGFSVEDIAMEMNVDKAYVRVKLKSLGYTKDDIDYSYKIRV